MNALIIGLSRCRSVTADVVADPFVIFQLLMDTPQFKVLAAVLLLAAAAVVWLVLRNRKKK